jgi:hypothetical protein
MWDRSDGNIARSLAGRTKTAKGEPQERCRKRSLARVNERRAMAAESARLRKVARVAERRHDGTGDA